jgi:hypothetical protein
LGSPVQPTFNGSIPIGLTGVTKCQFQLSHFRRSTGVYKVRSIGSTDEQITNLTRKSTVICIVQPTSSFVQASVQPVYRCSFGRVPGKLQPTQSTGVQNLSVGSTGDKKNCGVHMSFYSLARLRPLTRFRFPLDCSPSPSPTHLRRPLAVRAPPSAAICRRQPPLAHPPRRPSPSCRLAPPLRSSPPEHSRAFPRALPPLQHRPYTPALHRVAAAARTLPALRPCAAPAPPPPPPTSPPAPTPPTLHRALTLHLHRATAHAHCTALAHSRRAPFRSPHSRRAAAFLVSVGCRDGS